MVLILVRIYLPVLAASVSRLEFDACVSRGVTHLNGRGLSFAIPGSESGWLPPSWACLDVGGVDICHLIKNLIEEIKISN